MEEPEDNPFVREPDLRFRDVDELSGEEARRQVELLREAVRFHDYRYYVESDPVISDKAYDRLFERLKRLEDEFGLQSGSSPTRRVGGEPVEGFESVEHTVEMLSLDASEDEEEVRGFADRVESKVGEVEYHCEPKFDGLSVEVVYEDGEFVRAVTRGNGVEGDDISENVKTIRSVPLKLRNAPGFLAVRGEIYMPKDGFQELNSERVERGDEPFANPRNAAAGTVRQLDPDVVAERPLDVYFYSIMDTTMDYGTHREAMNRLKELGFPVNRRNRLVESIDGFIRYRNSLMEERESLRYDIDGVVVKVNSMEKREELGVTSSHPRWAYAYKFPARTGETKVRKIVVQVGRTGKLTPVALFDPVDVKGVTISRATLHNEAQAQELGITEDSVIEVERAGDVIPEVKEVRENRRKNSFQMPEKCPVCGSEVIQEGKYHFCSGGASCPAQLKRSLQHYASREALDIEGMGEKVANQLVDNGTVEKLPDIYKLEKQDLTELDRFAEKSAEKLLQEIEDSKQTGLASFLTGLGIRHVGKATARQLSQNHTLKEIREADRETLEKLAGIGPEASQSIVSFFKGHGGEMVDKLLELGVEPQKAETGRELQGLKLVITGSIKDYTREELKDLLERHGADVTSTISTETDYLITGENPGETKVKDAEEQRIEKLSEKEFREKILSRLEN
ncbi:MAG: NAD-dependent DNA ligase LigA [Candidatus Nanohalobium sp.]